MVHVLSAVNSFNSFTGTEDALKWRSPHNGIYVYILAIYPEDVTAACHTAWLSPESRSCKLGTGQQMATRMSNV
jgi:hypothetical protein